MEQLRARALQTIDAWQDRYVERGRRVMPFAARNEVADRVAGLATRRAHPRPERDAVYLAALHTHLWYVENCSRKPTGRR